MPGREPRRAKSRLTCRHPLKVVMAQPDFQRRTRRGEPAKRGFPIRIERSGLNSGLHPVWALASPRDAPSHDSPARLQELPRRGGGAPRARGRRHRRPERLGQVERGGRPPLGDRLAQPVRAARGEARRRPVRGERGAATGALVRGRAELRQRGRLVDRPALRGGLDHAAPPSRRRGAVRRQRLDRSPHRPRRVARRRRPGERRHRHRPGQGRGDPRRRARPSGAR